MPTTAPLSSTTAAVLRGRSRKARVRIGRTVLALLIAATLFGGAVAWQRDRRHVEAAMARLAPIRAALSAYLARHGQLPVTYPPTDTPFTELRFTYVPADMARWTQQAPHRVVVGYGPAVGLIFPRNGHAVLWYDRGTISIAWLAGRELGPILRQQALASQAPPAGP